MVPLSSIWETVIVFHRPDLEDWLVSKLIHHPTLGMFWTEDGAALTVHLYASTSLDLTTLVQVLQSKDPDVRVRQRRVRYRDWQRQWQRRWRPVRVGRRWVILPPWLTPDPSDIDRIPIIIEPRRAFGTGLHETTQLMLGWLERVDVQDRVVADVGTGTGILAIAAARAGAYTVYALDIDPEAIEEARANVARNGLTERIACIEGSFEVLRGKTVDVVLTNLDLPSLLEAIPAVTTVLAPNGVWIVGGITREHYTAFRDAVRGSPLRIVGRRSRGMWTSLQLICPGSQLSANN